MRTGNKFFTSLCVLEQYGQLTSTELLLSVAGQVCSTHLCNPPTLQKKRNQDQIWKIYPGSESRPDNHSDIRR